MTYKEQFDSALKCKTRKEAKAWVEKEVVRYWQEFGIAKDEAERTILSNLGYMAGYYEDAVMTKIYRLFRAEHPIFGAPQQAKKVSPENAVRIGQEMAKGRRG